MIERLRSLWHPERFHYHHRLARPSDRFEGWYLKVVDAERAQPYAFIPGVFLGDDRHAFVQVLDGEAGTAAYHRFPLESFRAARDRFEVEIAGNRFGPWGFSLDIGVEETSAKRSARGEIRFGPWRPWPVTPLSPGVMGPYSFVPFMQCNHAILSLDHALEGALEIDGLRTSFAGGRGYVEKDWGSSFPAGYVWTHSNHFAAAGTSLTAAVATIPWLTGEFPGYIIGFLHEGTLYRFTTYNGGVLERLAVDDGSLRLRIRNRTHRLAVEARRSHGAILHAPYEKQMLARVAETMSSEVDVHLSTLRDDATVFRGRGVRACLEAQGRLPARIGEGGGEAGRDRSPEPPG